MNTSSPQRSAVARTSTALIGALALVASLLLPSMAAAADEPAAALPDGLSQETAAGSCWEIKQNTPDAPSGVYWLVTPQLQAPDQFYCDQETEGGGWVLIGRGREAWKGQYNGWGTPARLRDTPTGVGAFPVAQLPSRTVDGLLNGQRVDVLSDGVRVRRAMDTSGSQWQEVRFGFTNRDRWVWVLAAEHRVGSYRFGSTTGSGGQTNNFGRDNAYNRVVFAESSSHGYGAGFAYGGGVAGTTASDSYLWSASNGQGNARPFAQVFLRPQLRISEMAFAEVPAPGTPAQTQQARPDSNALPTTWGVTGFGNGNAGELNTEVAVFAEVAGKVFVGGNFRYVQRTEGGQDQVEQRFLAAFDVVTGQWDPTFRPTLNGQVKALAALPDGRLAVGGQFSSVNGQPHTALAILDPSTGATSTGWSVAIENRNTGGVPYVRGLDVRDGWLYVAGSMTHLVGSEVTGGGWNGGRIAVNTGRPDTNWNPRLNGTSIGVDASDRDDRTYFSGYFRQSGTVYSPSMAALSTAAGAGVVTPAWEPSFSKSGRDAAGLHTGNIWQLGIAEAGDHVWVGGSEHSLFSYNRDTFALSSGSITKAGGDFQVVTAHSGNVYAGCHCGDFVYQDAYSWDNVGSGWTQGDKISLLGAWDAATQRYIPDFSPGLQARAGYGAWGLFVDSRGVLWAGGDFSRSLRSGQVNQWSGGYVRFAPVDTTAPTTPSQFAADTTGAQTTLAWGASSDAEGPVVYEVIRDGRVIATTSDRSYVTSGAATATTYAVRARDAAGNRSASTAPVTVDPPSHTLETLVAEGSTWAYRFSADALASGWTTAEFDDAAWQRGPAPLGRGTSAVATNIDPDALSPRPLSAQARATFSVEQAAALSTAKITVIANDGVVVYLNGTEIGRHRMPTGTLTQNSYATGAVTHATAAAGRITFDVPDGLLVDGVNVVAASSHANYRSTPDISFDLLLTAERGELPPPPEAPATPEALSATATGPDSVSLTWTTPSSGGPATGYTISRDGAEVATTAVGEWADTGLSAETTYTYEVHSTGPGGSSPAAVTTVTTPAAPPPPGPDELPVALDTSATWAYRFSSDPLPGDWSSPEFDDAGWSTGAGLFAVGVPGDVINLNAAGLSPRPLSAQFRTRVEVVRADTLADGTVSVIADDGVVVYINGVEIGRRNLPTVALGQNTYATAAPRHSAAAANRAVFTVPAALWREGENIVSASVHANYRNTPDLSFQLALSAERAPAG